MNTAKRNGRRRIGLRSRLAAASAGALLAVTSIAAGAATADVGTAAPSKRAASGAATSGIRSMPVAPHDVVLTQPDGGSFTAQPWGNITRHGYEADGHTVMKDAGGVWRFVDRLDASGAAVLSASRPDQTHAPAGAAAHLRPSDAAGTGDRPGAPGTGPERAVHTPVTGNRPLLVILAQFTDRAAVGSTPTQWAAKYFGGSSSVRDYYDEQSYGAMEITAANESSGTANDGVVGWVNLAMNHPNSGVTGDGADDQTIARNAILAANPYVNFATYDTNGDGAIDANELAIVVIAAGYETAYGGPDAACGPSVWGHQWGIGSGGTGVSVPVVDGKQAGGRSYMLFGEYHCASFDTPGHMATIGIMAHELGHAYGFPDLYDVDGSSEGIGNWSLMASGSWNYTTGYQGSVPAGLDPFSKSYQRWLTPAQVAGTNVSTPLDQVETNRRVVRVLANPNGVDWNFENQSGAGEYFLIENRQQTGYDAGLPGCGVLIWHIDESVTSSNNANATDSRRLIDLEEADGWNDLDSGYNRGDDGDPYPGSSGATAFDDTTSPNSKLYNGSSSGVSVSVPNSSCSSTATVTITAPGTADPGMLRVASSPAVPTQISVDGAIADTWGLQWLKLPVGTSHQVCFDAVAGFTTPSCKTVTLNSGLTTTVTGNFAARGYLRVATSPPVASRISVDGIPRNNWGLYTDMPVGSHQVCFGAVAHFTPPACQTVNVTAGGTTSVTGTFSANAAATGLTGVGLLRVTTSPSVPSQITVDGQIADTWGLNWLEIAPGSHTVCFTRVAGYTTPACQSVTVTTGNTTTVTGQFVTRGYLRVVTSPAVPGTITVNGKPANDWGVYTDMPTGSYTVCFGAVPDRTTPSCKSATVTAGVTTTVTGNY